MGQLVAERIREGKSAILQVEKVTADGARWEVDVGAVGYLAILSVPAARAVPLLLDPAAVGARTVRNKSDDSRSTAPASTSAPRAR